MTTISYKEFLINNTNISKQFYNDFFSMFNEEQMTNLDSYLIDHEKLQKWLEIKNRNNFMINIKKKYIENKHYKITYPQPNKSGGNNKEILFLTVDTALEISMQTKTKGSKICKYFIEVNKTLLKYKDLINNKLKAKIQKLENNQKPNKLNNTKMYIYVIKALNTSDSNDNLYKIGKTKNIKNRLNTYNSGLANNNNILFHFETTNIDETEKCLKNLLVKYQYRKYKEVYDVPLEVIIKLTEQCDSFIKRINKNIIFDKKNNMNDNYKIHIKYE